MNKLRMEGKVAVVTGVGSGMGQAIAKMFAEEGAGIVGCDFNETTGQQTIKDIVSNGGNGIFVRCDLRNRDDTIAVREKAIEHFGKVTTLVNAAGVLVLDTFMNQSDEDMQLLYETNFRGCIWMMREFIPYLVEHGKSSVTNITSIAVYNPESFAYYYGAFKSGVAMLTRNLAREYSPKGVRFNVICPGPCDTGMTPEACKQDGGDPEAIKNLLGSLLCNRVGTAEDIAYCATFLASDEADWITASQFTVDGGASFAGGDHVEIESLKGE